MTSHIAQVVMRMERIYTNHTLIDNIPSSTEKSLLRGVVRIVRITLAYLLSYPMKIPYDPSQPVDQISPDLCHQYIPNEKKHFRSHLALLPYIEADRPTPGTLYPLVLKHHSPWRSRFSLLADSLLRWKLLLGIRGMRSSLLGLI